MEEADPQTASEMVADWETNLGLPDNCTVDTATTIQERHAAELEKYIAKGDQSVRRW